MAASEKTSLELSQSLSQMVDELIALRRELHACPELAGSERETGQMVMDHLTQSGLSPFVMGGTGAVVDIESGQEGPVLLLRADMDGLAVEEETGLPFSSRNHGLMHACGHDAHMAMLLYTARILARHKPLRGTVRLAFQPAEERGQGAGRMLAEGLLRDPKVDQALALHVWSPLPVGQIAALPGATMASVDSFSLMIKGRGGHAARPEETCDPIFIVSQVVTAAQSLISRRRAPFQPAVLSFTAISGGTSFNVIPEQVELRGTIRTYDPQVRQQLVSGLVDLAKNTAAGFSGQAEYRSFEQLPPLINDRAVSERVAGIAQDMLGPDGLANPEPLMVGEDFSLILEQVPGAMVLIGCGDSSTDRVYPHHHPRFQVDERCLPIGLELLLRYVYDLLGKA